MNSSVKAFIDRILRLQDEKKAMEADIRDVYAEAASSGLDKKILRAVVKRLNQNEADVQEHETLVDLYLADYRNGTALANAREVAPSGPVAAP